MHEKETAVAYGGRAVDKNKLTIQILSGYSQ
jgi:hypothetical protein